MKKYVVVGFTLGVLASLLLWLLKRRLTSGDEFEELYDSSAVPRELFGSAFKNIPDKP